MKTPQNVYVLLLNRHSLPVRSSKPLPEKAEPLAHRRSHTDFGGNIIFPKIGCAYDDNERHAAYFIPGGAFTCPNCLCGLVMARLPTQSPCFSRD